MNSFFRAFCSIIFPAIWGISEVQAQSWTFVSSPDWFNSDVGDLSGGTDASVAALYDASYASHLVQAAGWPGASGGKNGVTAQMATVYNQIIQEMVTQAGGSPQAFLAAGDLINGRWFNTNTLNMFDPGGTNAGKLNAAADVYFSWYRELFRQNGISTVIGALGDHDIGDNDWGTGSNKAIHVPTMKAAFGRNMVDPLSLPPINGVSARAPTGTGYEFGSFAKQINNVLFLTVDVFEYVNSSTNLHYRYGAVDADVTGDVNNPNTHLGWIEAILTAADADTSIDHVILQGHAPILAGVRKQSSSGMMMRNREDSGLWQVMRNHSHRHGGKVRLYFGGEVHTTTATKDPASDIVQLVHGSPPIGTGSGDYVVFTVDEDQITAELRFFDLTGGTGETYWQPSKVNSTGPSGFSSSTNEGTLIIDTSGPTSTYQTSGWLNLVRNRGVLAYYDFDESGSPTFFSNSGSLGNLYYGGNKNGNPTTVTGKFGNALDFDNTGDFVKTAGGLAPITEGQERTVSAWIKTTTTEFDAILSYGQDNRPNGEFNLRLANGNLQLNIDNNIHAFADNNPLINDGQWHHVAVVLPNKHENRLSDTLLYVDGVQYSARLSSSNNPIRTYAGSASNIYIGADAENLDSNHHFDGVIDEAALWGSALTPGKVRSLYTAGNHVSLGYTTLQMEMLFELFDEQSGHREIRASTWVNTSGLAGAAGDVIQIDSNTLAIVLDDDGHGVIQATDPAIIQTQPQSKLVFSSEAVSLVVEADSISPITYRWFKSDDMSAATSGDDTSIQVGPSNTLALTSAQVNDEGYYYCVVDNAAVTDTVTDVVFLAVKRLVAHWTLDEVDFQGGRYLDKSIEDPVPHPATPVGTPSFVTGADPAVTHEAVVVNAGNGWTTAGTWNPSEFTGQFTASTLVRWDGAAAFQQLVGKRDNNTLAEDYWQLQLKASDQALKLQSIGSPDIEGPQLPVNEWALVVVTFDGSTASIYLNGMRQNQGPFGLANNASATVRFGAAPGGTGPFNGAIDDVRLYNYALAANEVAQLYFDLVGQSFCDPDLALPMDVAAPNGPGPDCVVDIYDLLELLNQWLTCSVLPANQCL